MLALSEAFQRGVGGTPRKLLLGPHRDFFFRVLTGCRWYSAHIGILFFRVLKKAVVHLGSVLLDSALLDSALLGSILLQV